MNGKIYVITNKLTNAKYVGRTTRTLAIRFGEHKRHSKYAVEGKRGVPSKFQQEIVRYEIENFKIELIQDNIETEKELADLETYYIVKYDTIDEYNSNYGEGDLAAAIATRNLVSV